MFLDLWSPQCQCFGKKLAKDLYGTILGTLHFFMNSVLLFLDFLALSFTTSEVFGILVYFFLLIRPPSYKTCILLTLFLKLFSYSWMLVCTICCTICVQVFDILMYSAIHFLGAVFISVVHIPSRTGLSGWANIFFIPQWTGLSTSRVIFLLRIICALERFSFSLDCKSSSLVLAGSLDLLFLTSH